jgi:hypothetical protein
VECPARGYGAVFGWLQLVRSTDKHSAGRSFEMDPKALYAEVATPFCWFGVKPTLVDAPFRWRDTSLESTAHSFLCFSPTAVVTREVHAAVGFSRGFTVTDGDIDVHPVQRLYADVWDGHLRLLRSQYLEWTWWEGYHND